MSVARALYDFTGDAGAGELSFQAGDMIDIISQDVGEGWWEGSVNGGTPGLLPATYVELTGAPPPPAAPAPAPAVVPPTAPEDSDEEGDFSDDGDDDGWEDDGDDDDDDDGGSAASSGAVTARRPSDNFGRSGTIKRSNRFRASAFVKAGAEDYMIGIDHVKVSDPDKVRVEWTKTQGPGWAWPGGGGADEVRVSLGERKRGTFSAKQVYNVTYGGGMVQRRSKHFQWLHDRLVIKYTCICVPPLPDKSYNPKFGEKPDQKRCKKLQSWLRRVMAHPVLRQDKLSLQHFLRTNYAQTSDWKKKKKDSEKDPLVGGNFFLMINSNIPCPGDAMKTIETFSGFVKEMKGAASECINHSVQHSGRMAGAIRKEYQMIGAGFESLSKVCTKANTTDGDAIKLSMALTRGATTMETISSIVKNQPANDELPLIDGMKEYVGMLSQFNDAVHSSKAAEKKFTEVERQAETTGGVTPKEREALRTRLDCIHTVTLCEVHHFHEALKKDLKAMMQAYFQAQIEHHQQLIAQFEEAKRGFDELPF